MKKRLTTVSFNSYTQQICIDDAVVVDPDRVDNTVTNDGCTMRELRYAMGPPAGEGKNQDESSTEPLDTPEGSQPHAMSEASQALVGPTPPSALDSMTIQLKQDVKNCQHTRRGYCQA